LNRRRKRVGAGLCHDPSIRHAEVFK